MDEDFCNNHELEMQREMDAPWRKQNQESNPGPTDWNAPGLSTMPAVSKINMEQEAAIWCHNYIRNTDSDTQ